MSAFGKGSADTPSSVANIHDSLRECRPLYSTRTCEGFEAVDKTSGKKVLFWRLRFPLAPVSPEAIAFVERLSRISRSGIRTPRIQSFGVDLRGTAFLVTDHILARSVCSIPRHPHEVGPILQDMIKQVMRLHKNGIVLGDISDHSFLVDNKGRVHLAGILGSFDNGPRKGAGDSSPDIMSYCAPEQRAGRKPSVASDIYSLGVYAYRLFTGRSFFKANDKESQKEYLDTYVPSMLKACNHLPPWAEEILNTSLQWRPVDRFTDLRLMVKLIKQTKTAKVDKSGAKDRISGLKYFLSEEFLQAFYETITSPALVVGVSAVGILLFIYFGKTYMATDPGGPDVTVAAVVSGTETSPLAKKESAPKKTLWDYLNEEDLDEEMGDKDLSKYLHFGRKGSYTEEKLEEKKEVIRTSPSTESLNEQTVEKISKAENRQLALKYRKKAQNTLLRWSGRSSVDWSRKAAASNRKSLNARIGKQPAAKHGNMSPPKSSTKPVLYSRQTVEKVLRNASFYHEDTLIEAAINALEFKMYPEFREVFLHVLVEEKPSAKSSARRRALAKAAAGTITWKQLRVFGDWYSIHSELALLSACATAKDPEMAEAAFTFLSSRPLVSEPARSLLNSIKFQYWGKKRKLAKSVGLVGLADLVPASEISTGFITLLPYTSDVLLQMISKTDEVGYNIGEYYWCPYSG